MFSYQHNGGFPERRFKTKEERDAYRDELNRLERSKRSIIVTKKRKTINKKKKKRRRNKRNIEGEYGFDINF